MKMTRLMALLLTLLLALPALAEELPVMPNVPAADDALLAGAANAPGGTLPFYGAEDPVVWPMVPAEEDGITCLTSTNWGADGSVAAVYTRVEAGAGDALSFRYKTSTEVGYDLMQVTVNGEVVKVFTGEGDWAGYALAFPAAGAYEVGFLYSKDAVSAAGSDAVYIADVQLLSGEEAQAALAANPVRPSGGERALQVMTPGAREIVFDDPTFALTTVYGMARYYILPEGSVSVGVTLAQGDDPDGAFLVVSGSDTETLPVTAGAAETGYAFELPLADGMTCLMLMPARDCGVMDSRTVICFTSEEAVDELLRVMLVNGSMVNGWHEVDQIPATLTVIDQQGEFIEGVTLSVLTPAGLQLLTTDDNGAAVFSVAADAVCTVHIVDAPDGYGFDPDRTWTVERQNPDAILDVTRLGE